MNSIDFKEFVDGVYTSEVKDKSGITLIPLTEDGSSIDNSKLVNISNSLDINSFVSIDISEINAQTVSEIKRQMDKIIQAYSTAVIAANQEGKLSNTAFINRCKDLANNLKSLKTSILSGFVRELDEYLSENIKKIDATRLTCEKNSRLALTLKKQQIIDSIESEASEFLETGNFDPLVLNKYRIPVLREMYNAGYTMSNGTKMNGIAGLPLGKQYITNISVALAEFKDLVKRIQKDLLYNQEIVKQANLPAEVLLKIDPLSRDIIQDIEKCKREWEDKQEEKRISEELERQNITKVEVSHPLETQLVQEFKPIERTEQKSVPMISFSMVKGDKIIITFNNNDTRYEYTCEGFVIHKINGTEYIEFEVR